MRRYLALGAVALAVLPGAAHAQTKLEARYAVTLAGIPLGTGTWVIDIAADQYTAFTLADLLIPFHSGMREPWTGLGVIAGWLLIAISASFPLRKLTGYRFWRKAHWLTLPLMLIGFLHGIGSGTDSATTPMALLYGITGTLFIFLFLYRALRGRRNPVPLIPKTAPPLDRMTARIRGT